MARNTILLISGKMSNSEMTTISGLNLSYIHNCLPSLHLPEAAPSSRGWGGRTCAMLLGLGVALPSASMQLRQAGLLILPGSGHKKAQEAGQLALSHGKPDIALPSPAISSIPPLPTLKFQRTCLWALGFVLKVSHTSALHTHISKFKRGFQEEGSVISLLWT